ncbi:hypothetical protein F4775DRAFT_245446 [Biscogniauxia sp. FL1348]|nr:hypothetical protein F4775DRAFT_245446 [Biscogniauxia sp. FL1348]
MFHRAHLVEVLYDELDDKAKSRILTNKKVIDIRSDEKGVSVRCADGTVYDGSMVIGADGAHSCVRKSMRQLALENSATADVNPEQPWTYKYRTMWLTFPQPTELESGTLMEAHGSDASVQLLVADGRAWMFAYERIKEEERPTERMSYTQADVEAFAAKWGHVGPTPALKVRDAFALRYHAGMADLEEGMLEHYHWGRLVLAGDSAHKVTPNAGRGLNGAIQDSVSLTNELQRLLTSSGGQLGEGGAQANLEALGVAFGRYQKVRQQVFRDDLSISSHVTRMSAWENGFLWFLDRWVMPTLPTWLEKLLFGWRVGDRINQMLVFEFLRGEEPFTGKKLWAHPILKS